MPGKNCDEWRVIGTVFRAADADEGDRIIEGLCAPYDRLAPIAGTYLERLTRDTFAESVTRGEGRNIPLLADHDNSTAGIVGKPLEWRDTDEGLVGAWQLDDSDFAREKYRLAREGMLRGLSVGFQADPLRDDVDMSGDVPVVTRIGAKLREVSLVAVGAYDAALITKVRTAGVLRADPRIARYRAEMGLS
jgi:HK97 family phage prohead protease